MKALEREVLELRQANAILRKASAYLAMAELDRRPGQPGVQRRCPEPAVGGGLHLRRYLAGFVYVAFVVDVFARRIVGWRV